MALPAAPLGVKPVQPHALEEEAEHEVEIAATSRVWRHLRGNPAFWIGLTSATVLIVVAVGAQWVARYDPNFAIRGSGLTADGRPVGPSAEFWLGTDRLGRDYLSRLLHGA